MCTHSTQPDHNHDDEHCGLFPMTPEILTLSAQMPNASKLTWGD